MRFSSVLSRSLCVRFCSNRLTLPERRCGFVTLSGREGRCAKRRRCKRWGDENMAGYSCTSDLTTALGVWRCSGEGVGFVIERLRVRFPAVPLLRATLGKLFTHMCLCSQSSINWYRLRLGVRCTTGAVLCMLVAIGGPCGWRPTGATPASFLTCGCRCTAALKWLLSLTPLYKLT